MFYSLSNNKNAIKKDLNCFINVCLFNLFSNIYKLNIKGISNYILYIKLFPS